MNNLVPVKKAHKTRPFLEGKIGKMQKKNSKIFIVPNRPLGHTDHLYIPIMAILSTLSSPFMRFLFPNKNSIMQESHKWRKNINNILYTMILTKNRIM